LETPYVTLDKNNDKDIKTRPSTEENSLQYNKQDLDQEQNCDVNPVQHNNQNIHIHLRTDKNDYSSKISGVTLYEHNNKTAPNVCVELYWGHESTHPVYKTHSDVDGNFTADDLPPGYYTISAYLENGLHYKSVIKVLPSQNIHHYVLLRA
jgi:hypothetical protein